MSCFFIQGGESFRLAFNERLPSSVTSALAHFGPYGRVKVSRIDDDGYSLFGKEIPRK